MANGVKTYQIQINGITESVKAVESLNKELASLESRIKSLEGKSVGVKTSGGGSKSSSTGSLSEEEKIQKQIEQIDAKRVAYSKEIYQNYLAAKDVLKETVKDQNAIAASERLQAKTYSNTIMGMKQELADIKSAMQTVDLGDTDKMDAMVKRANELNDALKKIEESYGQFGRNVGNYQSAFDGFEKIKVEVAGTTQEFDNAKQALMTLKKELTTLQVKKDQGMLLSEEELKRFEELPEIVAQLRSSIQDAGKPMDALMDTMQSIVALMQTGKGVAAFFGVDGDEIERSIQKLVALQNAMQGLQTIQKQIQTREGIGAWIAPFTAQIDKATTKLLAFNTALLGTGKAANVASKGIKLASTAIKGLLSLGIIAVISIAIEKVMDLVESFNKLSDAEQAQKNVEEEMAKAYGEGMAKLTHYKNKLDDFNGSKKQEKKLVEELNKEFGTTLGTYKSVSEWQDVMKRKSEAYIKTLTLQAKAQALVNELTAAYGKLAQIDFKKANGDYDSLLNRWFGKSYEAEKTEINNLITFITSSLESVDKEIEQHNKDNKIGDYAPQIEKNTDKTKKALEEEQRILSQLQVRLMQDGLNKKLRQLDEDERQTINKLKENGRKTGNAIQQIERSYAALRFKEINNYIKNIEISIQQAADNISNVEFGINDAKLKNQIVELQNMFEQISNDQPIRNTLKSYSETKEIKKFYMVDDTKVDFASRYENLFRYSEATNKADEYYKLLINYIKDKDKQLLQDIADYNEAIYKETDEDRKAVYMKGLQDTFKKVEAVIEKEYANELLYVRNYTQKVDQTLTESFEYRLEAEKKYDNDYRQELIKNIAEQGKLNNVLINNASSAATEAEEKRYQAAQLPLEKAKIEIEESIKNFKARNDAEVKLLEELKSKLKVIEDQMEQQRQQHYTKLVQITDDTNNKLKKNSIDVANQISAEQQKTFDNQISNLRDAQSKINEIMSKQPVYNKLGIVNMSETKKQYKEIEDASKRMISEIITQQALLNAAFSKGLIKPEAMNAIKSQLNDIMAEFKQMLGSIKQESDNVIPRFIESCQIYVQAAVDSFQTIMSAVWDAQDVQFEKQQDLLDKMNEELDKKLDEQQEIVQQHKDAIDSIEDELATSRGDRRQHLIDQINEEMAAQRAAQKQAQKLAKEKEALDKKQEKLDKDRKKAQYKRDMLQAVVNGALAVTMAAVNAWPMPAIAMMAAAAAATAAQIAIMASNKPYRVGGQLEGGLVRGKRHTQGGVPVGNTGIEVEGDEMIIRRESTMPNIDLLNYINKSQRRLDLDDFIEFYSSGKIKNNIKSISPKTKFADGGVIPTISNNYSFDDRLIGAFEEYSNRPVVVSVVDINNRQSAVRNVQVLAGLSE